MSFKGVIRDDVPQLEMKNCARCGNDFHSYIHRNADAKICHGCRRTPEQERRGWTRRTKSELLGQPLSVRNFQILNCLVDGMLNKEIAHKLRLDEGTIKVYVSEVLAKTGFPNRTAAAVWWSHNRDKMKPTP